MAFPVIGAGSTDLRLLSRRNSVPNANGTSPGVLLLVPGHAAALAAECELASRGDLGVTVTVSQVTPSPGASVVGHDLIAIDLSGSDGRFLAFGVEVQAGKPDAEILFFCEDAASPGAADAATLGLRSTVVGPGTRAWLVGAFPALVGAARARRALRLAEAVIPPLPGGYSPVDRARTSLAVLPAVLPLPLAEGRFREAYVRGVLASAGDRTHAAKQAGIPYRTFCRILQIVEAGTGDLANQG